MALTNFGRLTNEQLTVWSRKTWRQARNLSFINRFVGSDENSLIQRVTELKKDKKGARCVMTLVADLEGDGVAGDRQLEGNEEALKSYDVVIRIDQLRHANRHEGKMADQKSVVAFRENSRNVLSYWLSDRMDQLAFQTLAGVSYTKKPNGAARVGSDLPNLEFADDVSTPSTKRKLRWTGTALTDVTNATSDVATGNFIKWGTIIELKAYAKDQYVRGIKENGGDETFHLFVTPKVMAKLKQDTDYLTALRQATPRSKDNAVFTGNVLPVDGVYIHEFRHVPNTDGLTSGVDKWGSSNNVDGAQILFCGAQALGMADIGDAEWVEKGFDYDNQQGISYGKIFGFLKPKFHSIYANSTQDFGVISCYVSLT